VRLEAGFNTQSRSQCMHHGKSNPQRWLTISSRMWLSRWISSLAALLYLADCWWTAISAASLHSSTRPFSCVSSRMAAVNVCVYVSEV
jgi:acyl carrier protein phosphodiesterase